MKNNPLRIMFYGLDCEERKPDYYSTRQYGPTQRELDNNSELKLAWENYLEAVKQNIPANVH